MKRDYHLNEDILVTFRKELCMEEKSRGTVEKYLHDLKEFGEWLGKKEVTKERAILWKDKLTSDGLKPSTINSKLSALNKLFTFWNRPAWKVRYLKIQKRIFRNRERELTRDEYQRLILSAREKGKDRLELLMETICASGIRVSEVKYITVEAAILGRVDISMKGKNRTILLPSKLCRKLLAYAKKQKTASGEIFLTRGGTSLSRRQIWAEMKAICEVAHVSAQKVFPHNLRHLFARTFYQVCHDVVKLADVLGHSSIETTRIYLVSSGAEHLRKLEKMKLVL